MFTFRIWLKVDEKVPQSKIHMDLKLLIIFNTSIICPALTLRLKLLVSAT